MVAVALTLTGSSLGRQEMVLILNAGHCPNSPTSAIMQESFYSSCFRGSVKVKGWNVDMTRLDQYRTHAVVLVSWPPSGQHHQQGFGKSSRRGEAKRILEG